MKKLKIIAIEKVFNEIFSKSSLEGRIMKELESKEVEEVSGGNFPEASVGGRLN